MIKLRDLFEVRVSDEALATIKKVMNQNRGWKPNPELNIAVGDFVLYNGKRYIVVDGRPHKMDLWDGRNTIEYGVSPKKFKRLVQ